MSRIYHYEVVLNKTSLPMKTKIFELYFEYLLNKNIDISQILGYENYFIIQALVRLLILYFI